MNILEYTSQEILVLLPYEPYDNIIGALSLKIEYENADKYAEYYLNRESVVNSYDDYIDYLFLKKQCSYIVALPYIKDDMKEQFEQTYKKFELILSKYQIKDAIQYINKNYEQICSNQVLTTVTFRFIKDKVNGIKKEVFIEIAKQQPYVWYCNLKDQIKYLLKNIEIVNILFSSNNLDVFIRSKYDLVLENLLVLRKYGNFKPVFDRSVGKVISFMEEIEKNIKQDNVIQWRNTYCDFCKFLERIKSPKFAEKMKKLEQYETLLQKEILENGHRFSFEIKDEDIESHLGKVEPKYEILQLTHKYDKVNDKIINVFEDLIHNHNRQTSLIDVFRENIKHNDYFSIPVIDELQLMVYVYVRFFSQYLLNEKRQRILFMQIKTAIVNICEQLKINHVDKGLINDILIIESALYNMIDIIKKNRKDKQIILQLLCYTLITYCCTFIEKLLRELFNVENKDLLFIVPNSLTLGDLLSEQNKVMHEILGYDLVRCLRYFLHVDENEVGENIRNRFAHFTDVTPKDFQPFNALKVAWLMLGVLNSLTFHYLVDTHNEKKK